MSFKKELINYTLILQSLKVKINCVDMEHHNDVVHHRHIHWDILALLVFPSSVIIANITEYFVTHIVTVFCENMVRRNPGLFESTIAL